MQELHDFVGAWIALVVMSHIDASPKRAEHALGYIREALGLFDEARRSSGPFATETFLELGFSAGMPPDVIEAVSASPDPKPIILCACRDGLRAA
jgi:hypothetical protein